MKNYENIKRLVQVFGIHEEALNTVGALKDILYDEISNRTGIDIKAIIGQANEHNSLYKRVAIDILDNKESSRDLIEIANLIHEDSIRIETIIESLNVVLNNKMEIDFVCVTVEEEEEEIDYDIIENYSREDRLKALQIHRLVMVDKVNLVKHSIKALKSTNNLPTNLRQLRKLKQFYTSSKSTLEIWNMMIHLAKACATNNELSEMMELYKEKYE